MTINFNYLDPTIRVPGAYFEHNAAQTPYQSLSRLLLIGQKLTGGTATAAVPIQIVGNPISLFGAGSHLAAMSAIARKNAPFQEIWALPLADAGGSAAATGKITISAVATVAGTLAVYIAGKRVRIPVSTADTDAQVCARLVAAINAMTELPVTAAVDGTDDEECNLTANNKGTLGNKIRVEIDYYGDEGPLASAMLTITAMSGGSGDPDITTALAALGDEEFDFIAMPFSDATNLNAVRDFLSHSSGRWSPTSQLYGGAWAAKEETQGNLSTFGNGRNDPHVTVMGYSKSPSPPWEWAAAYGAKGARYLQAAPSVSQPLQTLVLEGILPPKLIGDRFNKQQRQALYYDGVASYDVNLAGEVRIDRSVTTYQTNPSGSPDASMLDVETMYQTQFAIRYLRAKITGTWGRVSLRDTNPQGILGVATPDAIRDTWIHGYRELELLNVVENVEAFEELLQVERNGVDATRVDNFVPIDLVNQLRVIAVNLTTYLQYDRAL